MRFLISGGSGFIGSYLKHELNKKGHFVRTVGKSGENDYVIDLSNSYITIREKFDMIIHAAAVVHNEQHAKSFSSEYILTDINITSNLLKSIKTCDFKKFIFLSSISVYGITEGINVSIDQKTNPINGYGLTKLLNEQILQRTIQKQKLLILRLPLVNGPYPKGNILKAKKAVEAGKMVIFKGNQAKKSILELSDLVKILEKNTLPIGLHQVKSYDINFNEFILQLANNRQLIKLPIFFISIFKRFPSIILPSKIKTILMKISSSFTIKNTFELHD